MARFDTTNFRKDAKIYSVVGKATSGGVDEQVQVGMVGKIGNLIEDNVYEFLPLESGDTEVFYLATPEVDYDEHDYKKNTLYYFSLPEGAVADAVEGKKHDKFTVGDNGVEVSGASVVKGGYIYAKAGERKLQYKATKPDGSDDAIQIAVIEDIKDATQGITVQTGTSGARALNQIQMQYKLYVCRIIQ